MLLGLVYISAKNSALQRFMGVTSYDLIVLTLLNDLNAPCHYKRLYELLHEQDNNIGYTYLARLLKRNLDNKLITRTPVAGNVLYCITMEGKRLLFAYNEELNNIVNARISKLQSRIA